MTDDLIRTDDIRHDVLNALYNRRTGAHSAETIRTVFLASRGYSLNEVKTALADLKRLSYVDDAFEGMTGSIQVWQITAQGLTFKEKGSH